VTQTLLPLPTPLFSTVVSDANWGYDQYGLAKHGAARAKYSGSPSEVLSKIPVWEWAKPSGNLFKWATGPKIEAAIDVLRAWGYHVVTMIPWVKVVPSRGEIKRGVGFWGYSAAEYLLVCRRGSATMPKYRSMKDKPMMLLCGRRDDVRFYEKAHHDEYSDEGLSDLGAAAFFAKLGPHSRKPLSLFEWIESYFPGRYLELFARGTRKGWTCLGHETGWHLCEEGPVTYVEACERELILPELDLARKFKAPAKIIRLAEKLEEEKKAKKARKRKTA
jgi:N6-adenosine-specific RNA methylase IME4